MSTQILGAQRRTVLQGRLMQFSIPISWNWWGKWITKNQRTYNRVSRCINPILRGIGSLQSMARYPISFKSVSTNTRCIVRSCDPTVRSPRRNGLGMQHGGCWCIRNWTEPTQRNSSPTINFHSVKHTPICWRQRGFYMMLSWRIIMKR